MTVWPVQEAEDLGELQRFLKANGLPFEDVNAEKGSFFIYRGSFGNLMGCGGLEFYEGDCLLRSVAVTENQRGKAHGKKIVQDLIDRAKANSARRMYLLTETAPLFFKQIGFTDVDRAEAPGSIRQSSEFSSVCPVSARLMVLPL